MVWRFPGAMVGMKLIKYRLRKGFTSRSVGEKTFILSRDSTMHVLENATAVFLWNRLQDADEKGVDAESLGRAMECIFQVGKADAAADAGRFLAELAEMSVVCLVEE
jgi:hypothetical protein